MFQQAGMYIIWRSSVIFLFALSCTGYNVTVPPEAYVNKATLIPWRWNTSDYSKSMSGTFLAVLLNSGNGLDCPRQANNSGIDLTRTDSLVDGFVFAQNPTGPEESSGNFTFVPKVPGLHVLCTYGVTGNFSSDMSGSNEGHSRRDTGRDSGGSHSNNGFALSKFLDHLVFIDESEKINVLQDGLPTETPTAPTRNEVSVAPIIGGVVGGVALILLLLAVFFYRRLRYQRKLNQFHKDRMLLQQPPPSWLSSIGASTVHPPVTSPQGTFAARTLSPNRRSDVPLGPELTTIKGSPYHIPHDSTSESHTESHYSPSTYSVALRDEPAPVFRAQHPPGMGTQQV